MKYRNIIIGAFAALLTSCSLAEKPIDFIEKEGFYKTEKDLIMGVNSAYAIMASTKYYGREFTAAIWSYADFGKGTEGPNTCTQFVNGVISPDHTWLNNIWGSMYTGINRANSVIVHALANKNLDQEITTRIIAEAKFLRAWHYFNLVRLWGEVPIKLEPGKAGEFATPLSSIDKVYAQIIEDLEYAEANLWNRGEQKGSYMNDKGRATKLAATTLLAKVYLTIASSTRTAMTAGFTDDNISGVNELYKVFEDYNKYYQLCADKCEEAMAHPDFGMEADWSGLWSPNNKNPKEVLFAVQSAAIPGYGSQLPMLFLPKQSTLGGSRKSQGSNCRIIQNFLQASTDLYEDNDYRFNTGCATRIEFVNGQPAEIWKFNAKNLGAYVLEKPVAGKKPTGGGQVKHLCMNKFNDPNTTDPNNSDCSVILLRCVDAYLMHAEAVAELQQSPAAGYADLNKARERFEGIGIVDDAYAAAIRGNDDMTKFRNLIIRERLQEFLGECDRFFTLQRTGTYMNRCNMVAKAKFAQKGRNDVSCYYWPLPQSEVESNPALQELR